MDNKRIIIRPYGHTGNNMLEHMLALYLRSCVPSMKIYCDNEAFLNIFGLKFEREPEKSRCDDKCTEVIIDRSGFNLDTCVRIIKNTPNIKIIVSYCLFDHGHYAGLVDSFRHIYGNKCDISGFDETYLVMSIRLGDILNAKTIHPNYPVVPFSFYRFLLRKTGLKPVFLGQISDDKISLQLRRAFPNAIFISGRSVIQDFECLRRSKNLSIAVSTFSFLAGYLSDKNTTIVHVPLYGGFNRKDRLDSNFMVKDKRYHYYEFPSIKWSASEEQIKEVISDKNIEYKEIKI